MRRIQPGLSDGKLTQVLSGIGPDDKVIVKGSLFIDRVASSGS
jgi:hypothetical protein